LDDQSAGRAWSSALSTSDFAACVESGYQPIGFVQGCSVMSWGWTGSAFTLSAANFGPSVSSQGYSEQFICPHGFVSIEHRTYGMNYEQAWAEEAWRVGFSSAFARLLDEAKRLGAHGVIGITEMVVHDPETSSHRFTLQGTAVKVEGADHSKAPFTTFLAGQKLSKLLEAGFAPVAIVAEFVAVQVFASCVTEYQLTGRGSYAWGTTGGEVEQLSRAHAAARHLARERVRAALRGDILHAAHLEVREHEVAGSGPQIDVLLEGNRVRRFKGYDPVPLPRPVVKLVDE
jgi:hypothetical protein